MAGLLMVNGFSSMITQRVEGAGLVMLLSLPQVWKPEEFAQVPCQVSASQVPPTGAPFKQVVWFAVFQIVPTAPFMDTLRTRGPTPATVLWSAGQWYVAALVL